MEMLELAKTLSGLPATVLALGAVIYLSRELRAQRAEMKALVDKYDKRLEEAVAALVRVNDFLE